MCHSTVICILTALIPLCICVEVARPRGVALTKKVFYNPETDFTCLDGTTVLPFSYVNDDFCDCSDGSDEPGTSACPNGFFHCTNAGHKPLNIPSSRVNDGVCDCCDASDEYNSTSNCENNCRDMGKKARDEALRLAEVVTKGHEIRLEMSNEGKQRKEERRTRFEDLEKQKEAAEAIRAEKEDVKKKAEELEMAALEKHRLEEEAKKQAEEEKERLEKEKVDALEAFIELDQNNDGRLTVDEIQAKWVFDSNKDGVITDEEAKFFLNDRDEMDGETFLTTGWILMKPHYSMLNLFKGPEADEIEIKGTEPVEGEETTMTTESSQPEVPAEVGYNDETDDEDDDEDDDSAKNEEADTNASVEQTPSPYDEETQQLVDDANAARKEHEEANQNVGNLEREIGDLKRVLQLDFGEDEHFSPLHGQCYEYSDREYIYKLCPFDQTSQRPKSGGSDINLGRWQNWVGPEEHLHSRMKYDHGLSCWNGPARSTEVYLNCGMENKLVAVSEPNKCVYLFEFETPAACSLSIATDSEHHHEEL